MTYIFRYINLKSLKNLVTVIARSCFVRVSIGGACRLMSCAPPHFVCAVLGHTRATRLISKEYFFLGYMHIVRTDAFPVFKNEFFL